jgi:DNA-binding NtrC family response regulator
MTQKITILLVDIDDKLKGAFGNLLDKLFLGKQYNLIQANSVRKALDIIKNNHISLIITDLQLLDGSGISLLIQVKERFPNIPKIVLSAYTDLVTEDDLELLEVNYFFPKPPDLSALEFAIEKIFHLHNKAI